MFIGAIYGVKYVSGQVSTSIQTAKERSVYLFFLSLLMNDLNAPFFPRVYANTAFSLHALICHSDRHSPQILSLPKQTILSQQYFRVRIV